MELRPIIQHLFQQSSLDEVSLDTLERFCEQQPYFAVGQFLLLRKMHEVKHPSVAEQFQKTAIYFDNPLWLRQLMVEQTQESGSSAVMQPVDEGQHEISIQHEQEVVADQPHQEAYHQEPVSFQHPENNQPVQEWVEPDPLPPVAEPFAMAEAEPVVANTPVIESQELEESTTESPETTQAITVNHDGDTFRENTADLFKVHPHDIDPPGKEVEVVENSHEQQPVQSAATENNSIAEADPSAAPIVESDVKGKVEEQEMPIFQSYHTIDYFASQGIKVSAQVQPQDKLGTQLRSFTEWLKTMKRLPPSKLEDELADSNTSDVEALAAHSIEDKEIVTETMAEVLAKQGKTARALDIYHKLSLLNPAKSAYFADKIGELKNKTA
jgi:hypothetical protein